MLTIEQRSRYRSDFGVAWFFLPILLLLASAAALGVAWGLRVAYDLGWYLIILLPALGGLALAGVLYVLIGWAHCRNHWLAGFLGLVTGLVAYLGYYQLCFLEVLPPGVGWRVDLLPDYIALRMQTDVARDVGKPDVAGQDKKPFVAMNWFAFLCELSMMAGFAAGGAWNRARRAYCPQLRRWMHREEMLLPPESTDGFREALESGTLVDFVAKTAPASDAQTACRLILEYAAPSDGSPFDYPVYVTLEATPRTRPWHWRRNARRVLVRQVELAPAEVLALRPFFPKLTETLAAQHAELRDLPVHVAPTPSLEEPVTDVAQVTPVPTGYRQRVRTKWYPLWVNLIGLTPGVYFFGGAALAAGGLWLAIEKSLPLGWAAAVVGTVACAWGGYTGLYCLAVAENRWINRRLRQEISQRPDSLVDPRDPEALCVSLIPRENFNKIQLTMSTDLLLLKIDEAARQVLLEGDSDRYRIPAGSIAACEAQYFFHRIDAQHQNQLWMVRLMVHIDKDLRELLLSVNPTRWAPMTNAGRQRAAESVCERINALRG